VGEFDSSLFWFYSDVDYLWRMKKIDLVAEVCEESVALHLWGETIKRNVSNEERRFHLDKDKATFEKKWGVEMPEELI
jgi:GT2 family glycosyltransferase